MSSTTANTPAGSELSVQQPLTLATTLGTLVRREFWEHPALWRAPLIIAALLVGTFIIGATTGGRHIGVHVDGWDGDLSPERQLQAFAVSQIVPMFPLYLIMMLVLTFYLLDSLYAERKDRSILFWKSLPVSDGLTVLSKFLVAVVVVPVGVLVLAAACHVLLFLVWKFGVLTGRLPDVLVWSTLMWLKIEALLLACLALGALWYAPVAAALLLVSAWARRSPVMWVTLAPIVAMVVEWKFGTHYLATFLYYRSFGIWEVLGLGHGARLSSVENGVTLKAVLGDLDFTAAFTNLNLWLGVLATAALLYAAVRLRRYRDDSAG
ncbi:MAG TPA: ABC-2 transporter permease [Steroidobacteraceae bacterium]|jgi:ABC-2 type transport system permease protein